MDEFELDFCELNRGGIADDKVQRGENHRKIMTKNWNIKGKKNISKN